MKWFTRKGFLQGAFWATMINVFASGNDVIMRLMGQNLHWLEVSFFRYLLSTLMIIPFMVWGGKRHNLNFFHTRQPINHFWRAALGGIGVTACCLAVNFMPFSENTTIMFTQPFFFGVMAYFLLGENVHWKRWACTIIGFLGLLIVLEPGRETFQWISMVPVVAALAFASSDVLNKKMVSDSEPTYTMLFYFGLFAALLSAIPLLWYWQTPTLEQLMYLFGLGVGANMIMVCIFKAFAATEASSLMPFRYVEFLTAAIAEFLFFGVIPSNKIYVGAAIIIASAILFSIQEHAMQKKKENLEKKAA